MVAHHTDLCTNCINRLAHKGGFVLIQNWWSLSFFARFDRVRLTPQGNLAMLTMQIGMERFCRAIPQGQRAIWRMGGMFRLAGMLLDCIFLDVLLYRCFLFQTRHHLLFHMTAVSNEIDRLYNRSLLLLLRSAELAGCPRPATITSTRAQTGSSYRVHSASAIISRS
jgi:hypothetical protein